MKKIILAIIGFLIVALSHNLTTNANQEINDRNIQRENERRPHPRFNPAPREIRVDRCCADHLKKMVACGEGLRADYSEHEEIVCENGVRAKCPKVKCVPIQNDEKNNCCPPPREMMPTCRGGLQPILAPSLPMVCPDGTRSICSPGYICPEELKDFSAPRTEEMKKRMLRESLRAVPTPPVEPNSMNDY